MKHSSQWHLEVIDINPAWVSSDETLCVAFRKPIEKSSLILIQTSVDTVQNPLPHLAVFGHFIGNHGKEVKHWLGHRDGASQPPYKVPLLSQQRHSDTCVKEACATAGLSCNCSEDQKGFSHQYSQFGKCIKPPPQSKSLAMLFRSDSWFVCHILKGVGFQKAGAQHFLKIGPFNAVSNCSTKNY